MTNGRRNRTAGNRFELVVAERLRKIGFPHVITSRQGSRLRDSQKIDLMNSDEAAYGQLEYSIQCKNVKGHIPYGKVIEELPKTPGITNVIFHKSTAKVGNRFVERGTFAILYLDDFLEMVKKIKDNELRKI